MIFLTHKPDVHPAVWEDCGMSLVLRAASAGDIDALLGLWREAAENETRSPWPRESEHSMITFAEHQVRAGKAGAHGDFEQMLSLLVRATSGKDASLVFANPGDWGIDVLAGSLNGRVTVWQAKYFVQGMGRPQRAQIEASFATVVAKAAERGFTLARWVLCVPASMDARTRQWWEQWKRPVPYCSSRTTQEAGTAAPRRRPCWCTRVPPSAHPRPGRLRSTRCAAR